MVTGRINGRKQKEDNRMPKIGVQMMMLKQHVERLGPYATLKRVADIGFSSVEVSQIPMTPEVVNESPAPATTLEYRSPRSRPLSPSSRESTSRWTPGSTRLSPTATHCRPG